MSTTTISFNTPSNIKSRLQKIADANGITISDLMRMGAIQIVNQGLVIEPSLEPTEYLASATKSAEKDLTASQTTTIKNADDLAKHLANLRK